MFQLFLPIVMIVFQLWWMLALKFCIPPEIGLAAGITAELDIEAEPPQLDIDIKASVDLALANSLKDPLTGLSTNPDLETGLKNGVSPIAIANLQVANQRAAAGRGPSVTSGIVFGSEGGAPMSSRRFLGRGWSFPVTALAAGRIAFADGPEKVAQSIRLILDTEPGERIMRPTFGCGLRRYLMAPNTNATRALIQHDVELALTPWEPRIQRARASTWTPATTPRSC